MRKIFFASMLSIPSLCSAAEPAGSEDMPFFTGKITHESVDAFISKYDGRSDITDLRITSQGGDVKAAIKFGNWVHKKGLNIRVRFLCYSACANYIFVAGKNKVLERGSFVAWHGDMEQKDFRELIEKYEAISQRARGSALSDSDKLFLADNKVKYESLRELRKRQAELYSALRVNSEFGRIGQEPISYPSDGWTLTKKAMEHFGISNVEVPNGYATVQYFSSDPGPSLINRGPLLILDVDDSGKVFPVNLDQLTNK
jgi:hypothetical protein